MQNVENPLYHRIREVGSVEKIDGRFDSDTNCILHRRALKIDFNPLGRYLEQKAARDFELGTWREFYPGDLMEAQDYKDTAVQEAATFILGDMRDLRHEFPSMNTRLRLVKRYSMHGGDDLELHADEPTLVCAGYNDPMTHFARNEDVLPHGDMPNRFELKPDTKLESLEPGDIWCQRGVRSGGTENAFIHFGPHAKKGGPLRLFLFGEI